MAPKWRSFYARSRPGYAIWRHLENLAGRPNNSETNNSFFINNVRAVEQTIDMSAMPPMTVSQVFISQRL